MAETGLLPIACLTVVHNSIDAIVVLDTDSRIVKFNPSAGQLLSMDVSDLHRPVDQILSRWSGNADAIQFDGLSQKKATVKDAETDHVYDLQVLPIIDRKRLKRGSVLLVRMDSVTTNVKDSKRSDDPHKELLSKISHKLRTPLNGIQGLAEMLEYGTFGTLNERQLSATQRILERVDYLRDLLNELTNNTNLESNRMEYVEEETEVVQ